MRKKNIKMEEMQMKLQACSGNIKAAHVTLKISIYCRNNFEFVAYDRLKYVKAF